MKHTEVVLVLNESIVLLIHLVEVVQITCKRLRFKDLNENKS